MANAVRLSEEAKRLGLEEYILALELDGLAVVPPEVHGFPEQRLDQIVSLILQYAEEMTGTPFTLAGGPEHKLEFPDPPQGLTRGAPEPGQFLIQQLGRRHRVFRDLAVNPVAVELMRHMIGREVTRFSSHNSFVKWQGDFGYGPGLGMHADQTAMPLPWGRGALTANTNWCLTEYTHAGGCLAYVPGSHRYGMPAQFPQAVKQAVPVEAPRGSLIVFHGATWHGAFPRELPGMRLSIANYYRHMMVTSQEDISGSFPRELADDCDNPDLFRTLCGFADRFPYQKQSELVPRVAAQ
ncbi:MAG: phytanoyl-CoA dioxygenase family protein [Pseudomonadota bacterium]